MTGVLDTPLPTAKDQSDVKSETKAPDLLSKDTKLQSQKTLISEIDPRRCKPWKFHNRDAAWLTKERSLDIIQSVQKNGQIEPALVRLIKDDPNYDFEIIYGVRRWFACLQIPNQKLLAKITDADDKTCMVLMHAENSDSKDITEFERAFSFAQQLRSGMFKNQTEMAKAMGVTQGLISRMVKAAELFDYHWIKSLFQSKLEIKIKPAYKLVSMLKDSSREILIKRMAQEIETKMKEGEYFTPQKILKKLIAVGQFEQGSSVKREVVYSLGKDQVISCKLDVNGKVVLTFDNSVCNLDREALLQALSNTIDQFVA